MQGMRYRWGLPHDGSPAPLDKGFEPLVARLLASRGLHGSGAREFLAGTISGLEAPTMTPGVERGAVEILEAVDAGKRLVVYGDYDVDGITALTILVRTLETLRPDASIGWYIPHRLEEGYGLNRSALQELRDDGADVVVSVDCGISALDEARAAAQMGLRLIITDHHNLSSDGQLPEACVVVHPRIAHDDGALPECNPEPAGAGVAFKLAWQLCVAAMGSERVGASLQKHLLNMMALASLGTIADVVPLTGENRIIAKHGLRVLKHCDFVGIRALLEASGLADESISEEKVGFVLAPRINACGRMGHAREAAELLLTEDAARAEEIARSLTKLNDERRATEQRIVKEVVAMAQEEGLDDPSVKAIVLAHREWHPGVIGIVCSRIVDTWHKPTVLLQLGEEECAGSGRSIEGFSLSGALATCDDWLESHGGHDMAAGLRLKTEHYGSFRDAFMTLADERLDSGDLVPQLGIDCEARLSELTLSTGRGLEAFAPYGRCNEKPVVLLRDVRLTREPMMMGKGNNHLALHVTSEENVGALRLVGWRWGEHAGAFYAGQTLDIACEPSLNRWRGKETMEGVLRDVRVHDPADARVSVTGTSSIPS